MKKLELSSYKKQIVTLLSSRRRLVTIGCVVGLLLVIVVAIYGAVYALSPKNIRHPSFDHYHFRAQLVVDSQKVDFSEPKFQETKTANGTSCSITLNGTPLDFHDERDQMAHIHWGGITGGQFLKYFGWNFVSGSNNLLGVRYDQGILRPHPVSIKGSLLPKIPENAKFYVYTGNQNAYEKRNWEDFLNEDLEDFFRAKSRVGQSTRTSWLEELLFPKAMAHGGVVDDHGGEGSMTEEELTRLNNLIGNVVIFVQQEEPSEEAIQERFNNLVPLENSTCGG